MENLISQLLQARIIGHIFHLRVKGTGSFASHLAFGEFYELVSDFADTLAEQWQGLNQELLAYPTDISFEVPERGNEIVYIQDLLSIIDTAINQLDSKDKITSNILQDLGARLRQIIYKLTFLK
jgi:hypothetical protein